MSTGRSLPPTWIISKLGDVCQPPQYGWTTKAVSSGKIHLLRTSDITSGRIDWSTVPYCTEEPPDLEKYLVNDGDILISRAGSVGYSIVIRNPTRAVFASYLIRFKSRINEAYIANFLQSSEYWQAISEQKLGIAVPNVNATKLKNIEFPVAPLPEQARIVSKLEELFSQLDAGLASLERTQENLERYKASVLNDACEGRLVPTEAELAQKESRDYEPASVFLERILAERRKKWEIEEWSKLIDKAKKKVAQARRKAEGRPARMSDLEPEEWQDLPEEVYGKRLPGDEKWKEKYKEPEEPDQEGLPDLPRGWLWASIGQISNIIGGLTKNPKRKDLPEKNPYLRVANVYANRLLLENISEIGIKESEKARVLLEKGDMLVVEGNGSREQIGRVALWDGSITPCAHQNHLIKVRFLLPQLGKFVLYWLLSIDGRDLITQVASSTSGLYTLNLSKVSSFQIPLPPLAEQHRITSEIEMILSIADETSRLLLSESSKTRALKRSILSSAFSGNLVDQDPNDKPASVLLGQIREQKQKLAEISR